MVIEPLMNRRTIFFLILLVIFASRSSIVNAQILSGLFKSKIERMGPGGHFGPGGPRPPRGPAGD